MLKPRVQITDSGKADAEALRKRMRQLQSSYVTIGVHDYAGKYTGSENQPEVVEVALWMEFGTETIPERSFLRSTVDENASKINEWRNQEIDKIISEGKSVEAALSSIGTKIQFLIQNKIKSNVPPKLAYSTASTKRRKGLAPVTLIETGLLLRSITYKVHVGRD